MDSNGFRRLLVWQRARDLAVDIFRTTNAQRFNKEWALKDQLRRAAVSVPSNIAEGSDRGSRKETARFCYYARGSLAEISTQAEIASTIGLLDQGIARRWQDECDQIGRMLVALIAVASTD